MAYVRSVHALNVKAGMLKWDFLQILLILAGKDDLLDIIPLGGYDLLLEPADRQYLPYQGKFTGHGQGTFQFFTRGQREQT